MLILVPAVLGDSLFLKSWEPSVDCRSEEGESVDAEDSKDARE